MPTLILSPRHTDDTQKLWRACIVAKWHTERANGWHVPEVTANEAVVYGEPLFAQHIANALGLALLKPADDWLPSMHRKWRGREVMLMSLREARALRGSRFIKPADGKEFPAKVYTDGGALPDENLQPGDLPVLVQEVVEWESEFRCFVLERNIAAISVYSRGGALAQAPDESWPATVEELTAAAEFCSAVLADHAIAVPEASVLDVGLIRNGSWAVVESNAAWASGLYGCDPLAVLPVLRRACQADPARALKGK